MQSDISLATDPVIDFLYRRGSDAPLHVSVTDAADSIVSRFAYTR